MTVIVAGISEREAIQWLSDAVQAASDPTLTADELRRLLPVAAVNDASGNLADTFLRWSNNSEYAIGEYVVPAPRNGYLYAVAVAGVSAPVQPTWPTTLEATIADGSVTWECYEALPWVPTYSTAKLNRAAAIGWERKAGKLAINESFTADGASFDGKERREFCLEMAAKFAKKGGGGLGTMNLRGRTAQGDDYLTVGTVIVN